MERLRLGHVNSELDKLRPLWKVEPRTCEVDELRNIFVIILLLVVIIDLNVSTMYAHSTVNGQNKSKTRVGTLTLISPHKSNALMTK